jgi:hypothetical protein
MIRKIGQRKASNSLRAFKPVVLSETGDFKGGELGRLKAVWGNAAYVPVEMKVPIHARQ